MNKIIQYKKQIIVFLLVILVLSLSFTINQFLHELKKTDDAFLEKTQINILTWKNIPANIINNFQKKHPNYIIRVDRHSKADYLSFLDNKLLMDSSTDIIEIPIETYGQYVKQNQLVALDNNAIKSRFWSESVQYLQDLSHTDKIYGLPYESSYQCIWYNKSIFDI